MQQLSECLMQQLSDPRSCVYCNLLLYFQVAIALIEERTDASPGVLFRVLFNFCELLERCRNSILQREAEEVAKAERKTKADEKQKAQELKAAEKGRAGLLARGKRILAAGGAKGKSDTCSEPSHLAAAEGGAGGGGAGGKTTRFLREGGLKGDSTLTPVKSSLRSMQEGSSSVTADELTDKAQDSALSGSGSGMWGIKLRGKRTETPGKRAEGAVRNGGGSSTSGGGAGQGYEAATVDEVMAVLSKHSKVAVELLRQSSHDFDPVTPPQVSSLGSASATPMSPNSRKTFAQASLRFDAAITPPVASAGTSPSTAHYHHTNTSSVEAKAAQASLRFDTAITPLYTSPSGAHHHQTDTSSVEARADVKHAGIKAKAEVKDLDIEGTTWSSTRSPSFSLVSVPNLPSASAATALRNRLTGTSNGTSSAAAHAPVLATPLATISAPAPLPTLAAASREAPPPIVRRDRMRVRDHDIASGKGEMVPKFTNNTPTLEPVKDGGGVISTLDSGDFTARSEEMRVGEKHDVLGDTAVDRVVQLVSVKDARGKDDGDSLNGCGQWESLDSLDDSRETLPIQGVLKTLPLHTSL